MEARLRKKLPGGRFNKVPATRSRTMRAIRSRGNRTTELTFRLALVRSGLRGWKMHPAGVPGRPDFFFRFVFCAYGSTRLGRVGRKTSRC